MPRNSIPMKILVTGATGFLGTRVTQLLAEHGHTLTALCRRTSQTQAIDAFVAGKVIADVTDPVLSVRAAAGHDALVHMAADLSHWSRNRDRIYRTNVIGTRIMAEASKTAGVPKFLHVSSIAAIGYSANGNPIDETAENNFVPLNLLYHESKRLAEEEALDAVRYGASVVVVNPGVLYGPRSFNHTFGHTMLDLAAGRVPGHPSGGLSIADVDDVAEGIVAALSHGKSGERYILAGHNLTYAEAFRRQAREAGVPYRGREIPAIALMVAARAFELRSRFSGNEPRLTIDNARIAPLKMWYTSGKAESALGFRSRALDETLERMARAYRQAGALP